MTRLAVMLLLDWASQASKAEQMCVAIALEERLSEGRIIGVEEAEGLILEANTKRIANG